MSTYDITVSREGKFWHIEIPALRGATQAKRLTEVNAMAIDYISIVTGESPVEIDLNRDLQLPKSVLEHLERTAALRAAETEARTMAAAEARLAAQELAKVGLTVREVGEALGVSHQRAHQLIH